MAIDRDVANLITKYGRRAVLEELRDAYRLPVQFDCNGDPVTYTPLSMEARITLERYLANWRATDPIARKLVTEPLVKKVTKLGFEAGQRNQPPSEEYGAYDAARGILAYAAMPENK